MKTSASEVMLRARNRKVKEGEKLHAFQESLLQLCQKFEADVDALCKKHEVKINCWYSPSTIPNPNSSSTESRLTRTIYMAKKGPSKPIHDDGILRTKNASNDVSHMYLLS